jgi:hypothetical protein
VASDIIELFGDDERERERDIEADEMRLDRRV